MYLFSVMVTIGLIVEIYEMRGCMDHILRTTFNLAVNHARWL